MIVHKQQKTLLSCLILKWSTGIKIQVDAHIISSMKEEFNVLRAKKNARISCIHKFRYEGQNAESF